MKQFLTATFSIALVLMLSSAGCKHDDPNPGNSNPVTNPVSGTWTVTRFVEDGNDETSDYSGYTFDFAANGTFSVTRNGQTTTGSWTRVTDDNRQKMVIAIVSSVHEIDELNEDWVITSSTGTSLQLVDDNPASAEELHFTKQ